VSSVQGAELGPVALDGVSAPDSGVVVGTGSTLVSSPAPAGAVAPAAWRAVTLASVSAPVGGASPSPVARAAAMRALLQAQPSGRAAAELLWELASSQAAQTPGRKNKPLYGPLDAVLAKFGKE
jgi:hypothetical protein